MAKIKLNYFISKDVMYVKTARVIIEIFYKNLDKYNKTCGVYEVKDYKTWLINEIDEHEIIFTNGLTNAIKDSINKIEYTIKNDLDHELSYASVWIDKKNKNYTFKILNELKNMFGELTEEEKNSIKLPLDNRKWILENINKAYRSISEELKQDKEILNTYVDSLTNGFICDDKIKCIPNRFLNDKEFLLNFKEKIFQKNKNNDFKLRFSLELSTIVETKIYEVFKDWIIPYSSSIYFKGGGNETL